MHNVQKQRFTELSQLVLKLNNLLPVFLNGINLKHELISHPEIFIRPGLDYFVHDLVRDLDRIHSFILYQHDRTNNFVYIDNKDEFCLLLIFIYKKNSRILADKLKLILPVILLKTIFCYAFGHFIDSLIPNI